MVVLQLKWVQDEALKLWGHVGGELSRVAGSVLDDTAVSNLWKHLEGPAGAAATGAAAAVADGKNAQQAVGAGLQKGSSAAVADGSAALQALQHQALQRVPGAQAAAGQVPAVSSAIQQSLNDLMPAIQDRIAQVGVFEA